MHTYIHTHTNIITITNTYIHTYGRTFGYIHTLYIYIYIYIYIFEHTYTHTHTHTHTCTDIHNLHAYVHTNVHFQHFITDKTQSQVICLVFRDCINLTRKKHVRFPNFSISKLWNISRLRHRLVPVQCGCSLKPYSTTKFHNILKNTQRAKKLSWLKTWVRNMFRFIVYLTKHETEYMWFIVVLISKI